ncbi:MAG: DHH family phosphoesterase [Candidatus Berkelbacteria bacterium]|nr:DHH family phosphoesterase [Candidatus Berkelbacteria bacterium]
MLEANLAPEVKKTVKLLKKSKRVLIFTHQDTDGDALGSLLGLTFVLQKLGVEVHPILTEKVQSNFSFLPGLDILEGKIVSKVDLIVFLDIPDFRRIEFLEKVKPMVKKIPSILIDHHPRGDLFQLCTYKIQSEDVSSTSELLYYLICELGVEIDKKIATALLTGIFTDTCSFQNPNTRAESFEIASVLLSAGARIEKIAASVFHNKTPSVLKLWGKAMAKIWKNEKYNFMITVLTDQDFKECQIDKEGAEGVANFLNLTANPLVNGILFLVEQDGKIKGSLRTQKDNVDLSQLARILGGGGHKKAAGFLIDGKLKLVNNNWQVI